MPEFHLPDFMAVTAGRSYRPAPLAFIVLPLVSAIFVDLANALVTRGYLALWTP